MLDEQALATGVAWLTRHDADLAGILARHGAPPLWPRPQGFATLVHIILEQQVSLASARAAFDRLLAAASPLTPQRFVEFDAATLKMIGFSRQKTAYCRSLAQALLAGELDMAKLEECSDQEVFNRLTALKGIGAWTANIYLLMALGRPDVWPASDLALMVAVQQIKRLPTRPTVNEMTALAEGWRPWRAVAARLLWHHYLSV
jgi:DNA-3-methyladenine glycosylase II